MLFLSPVALALPVAVKASVPGKVTESRVALKELQVAQVSFLSEGEDTDTERPIGEAARSPRASLTQAQL